MVALPTETKDLGDVRAVWESRQEHQPTRLNPYRYG